MATITNTKLSQGQIKGTGKDHLGAELSAVESAIAGALGKAGYEGGADINLKDLGEMVDGNAAGMTLKVDVAAGGFDITGAGEMAAGVGRFGNTSAGILTATSAAVSGVATVGGSFDVNGAATLASVTVEGTSALVGNVNASGNVTIAGDLFVNGTQTVMNTAQVEIEDDHLVIAKGKPSLVGGEGFALVSDAGTHFMHWDVSNKWSISDGVKSVDFKAGDKMLVDSMGVHGSADGLALDSAGKVQFKDSFMTSPMDLSKTGEYAPVFGAGSWAAGLGLIGALNKVRTDSGASLLAASGTLVAALDAERLRAMAAEAALQAEIDAEEAARAAADTAHDAAIAAEVAARIAGDATLTTNLAAEVSRAQAAESVLNGKIATEKSRAEAAELVLTNGLAAEIAARIADVNSEESRALAAEAVLDGKIVAEASRALAAETVLDGKITTEKNRAEAAELVLTNALAAEVTRAQVAEATLTTNLAAEVTRAQGAEAVLDGKISTEKARAEAAELVLTNAIAAEVARAQAAEAVLDGKIAQETTRAVAAEGVLDGKITTLSTKIATQATRIFVAVVPNGPDLQADSDLTGYSAAEFVMPAGKVATNYDVYLNGQQMIWNSDFAFVLGKIQFKFVLKPGDVVRFREF